jgi:hypothetical protein
MNRARIATAASVWFALTGCAIADSQYRNALLELLDLKIATTQ